LCYRYKLLAQIIVDEKKVMQMNVFRFERVHSVWKHFRLHEYFFSLPKTLREFEEATERTHIMSARCIISFYASPSLPSSYTKKKHEALSMTFTALTEKCPMRTLSYGTESKGTSGQAR
jgi:hypothetical protein